MNPHLPRIPPAVGKILSRLPAYPGSLLFVAALKRVLTQHLPAEVRILLTDKKLRIKVIDAELCFDFVWRQGGFEACRGGLSCDLTIAASVHDFYLLAQRREDPDTLFFSRRLLMEGDTELGLLLKNTLDAIEFSVFDPARLAPSRLFARLRP